MKKKYTTLLLITVIVALLLSPLFLRQPENLPEIHLPDGGKLRILKITYTTEPNSERYHALGGAPKPAIWIWNHFPAFLKKVFPSPSVGEFVFPFGTRSPVLSIWWTYADPHTGKPVETPYQHEVKVTSDSGTQLATTWSLCGPNRYFPVKAPPTNSRHLRFNLTVNNHPAEFTITNPAFRE